MKIEMRYAYHPEKNGIQEVETDLSIEQFVKGINSKEIKILDDYLQNSKQHAFVEDDRIVVMVE